MNKLLNDAKEIIIQMSDTLTEELILNKYPIQKKIYDKIQKIKNFDILIGNKFELMPIKISQVGIGEGRRWVIETHRKFLICPLKDPVEILEYPNKIPLQYLKKACDLQTYFGNECKVYVSELEIVKRAERPVFFPSAERPVFFPSTERQEDPVIFFQLFEDKDFTYLIGVWD